jgi:integrase
MRGTITKRGKSWLLKYDLPRENGVGRQRYATVQGTFKDAQRELTKLLGAVDDGTHVDHTRMTVGAYIAQWLNSAPVSPKTLERYEQLSRCQLSRIGDIGLQKLRP